MVDAAFAPFAELLPPQTEESEPFWEGLAAGELRLQYCKSSDTYQHPPESFCYFCGSTDLEWRVRDGAGEVYSFIVVHQPYHVAFRDRLPYVVATVQLDDGPRLLGAIFDIDPASMEIGMRVKPRIEAVSEDGAAALFFEPA
jgi:uncharacterized OB-fold protein